MKPIMSAGKINYAVLLRWLGTLTSVGLLVWIVTKQDWPLVFMHIQGVSVLSMFGAILLYVISNMFNILRWCILLWSQNVDISFIQALQISWAGSFSSNFLPSTIGGDGIRVIAIYRITKRKTISFGSVILDRIINVASMVFFVPLPLWMFWGSIDQFAAQLSAVFWGDLKGLLARYFSKIVQAYKIWSEKKQVFVYAFFVSFLSNIFFTLATFIIARQLNIEVTVWQILAIQVVIYFFVMIPVSVNGYGVRELAFVVMYSAIGVSVEKASALAFITRFLMFLSTLPGGFWLSKVTAVNITLEDVESS